MRLTTRVDLLGARVVEGDVPPATDRHWEHHQVVVSGGGPERSVTVAATSVDAVVEVHNLARFHVAHGQTVTVERHPGADRTTIQAWLYGTVASLVAGQQGRFALHASVVELDGVRVGVAGRRGAGKSTSTLAAAAAGGTLVCDDLTVLRRDGTGRALLEPFGRPVHVWADTALHLGISTNDGVRVLAGHDKWTLPAPGLDAQVPLDTLVALSVHDGDEVRWEPVPSDLSVAVVRNQTYRTQMMSMIWPAPVFQWQNEIARSVHVYRVGRPRRWSIDEVVAALNRIADEVRK